PGKKVFVAGALTDERVRYLRRASRRKFDEAELLEVIEPSPERIEARCAAFGRCGGCALQHVTTQQQRRIKSQVLADSLQRIGGVEPGRWLDAIVGPDWNYRRRARLAVKDVHAKGRILVGFRERHAPYVTDMHRCEVLAVPIDGMLDPLAELIGGLSVRARLPQIEVALADNATALVFRVLERPSADDVQRLRDFGTRHGIRIHLQPGGPDSVELLWPDPPIEPLYYGLADFDLRMEFEPAGFVQVNGAVNRRLVAAAVELLDPQPADRVLDLYCGIGNFSLPLARRCATVLGVEGDEKLVAGARHNAARNAIEAASFRCADLGAVDGREEWLAGGWDRVLLDPARNGAAEVVAAMGRLGPQRIVYVSCHPGTLARDAGTLVHGGGYRLAAAGIVDMFPHTAHVEAIAVFDK
ncbi:MAG: 23S rRNA (uracil(1939)-C(5))-methyltransferase RlmD, partial [Woeseiaceae bacterium]